jgi:predicted metalloprotease
MRWTPGGVSGNIEDRRGMGGMRGMGGGTVGVGGIVIALLLSVFFGQDFVSSLGTGTPSAPRDPAQQQARNRQEQPMVEFVSFVLDDTQNTWRRILGSRYRDAILVLFQEGVQTACGAAPAAVGPFYCPADERVYIDLSFFEELESRFGAPGDFAQAYVLAHEVGHHVQNVLGLSRQVSRGQQANPDAANELSVRQELQADCLAGVWGNSTAQRGILERGDVEEGLGAASAVGDDRIQRRARGQVNPDSFTHGSSAQRMQWFRRGLDSGDVATCDTFNTR